MPSTDFDEFVIRQQIEKAATASIDWNQQRDDWLLSLSELYARIETYLQSYRAAGQAEIEYRDIPLNEANIGSYTAQLMVLRIGLQEIQFTPIGTLLIGSKGRVDVLGPAGTSRLVLIDKKATNARSLIHIKVTTGVISASKPPPAPPPTMPSEPIEWTWKIVSRPPEMRFTELTQESFFEMILEVANG
jgi:hypothetical protein